MGASNEDGLDQLSVPELIKLGYEARKFKDHDRALGLFELALEKNPNNINLSVEVARSLVDKGDVDSGYRILTSLGHLNQFPIYALLGRIERMKGDRESALHYYSLAFDLKPDHPTLPAEIATELRVLERLDESEQILLTLSERLPNSPHALNGLAQIARIRGDREKALSYYRALEVLDRSHPNVHIDIAIELRELGRLDEAAQSLACSRNPNQGAIFHQKGLIAIAQEEDDLAIECFKTGIEQQRDHPACHQALIAKLFQMGSLDEVRVVLDTALEMFPNHVAFRRFEYRYMRVIGKVDKAIELVQALNKAEPKNLDILHDLVEYLIFLGRFESAQQLINSYQHNPHKDRVLFLKSKLAMAQFMVENAVEYADEAILINPKNIQYQQHRLSLNIMLGNVLEAQDNINTLKEIFQNKGWNNKKLKSVGGFPAQILREVRLNPYANRRLADSKQLDLVDQIYSVAQIVKDEPNHLGSALRLLTLMAQDKSLHQGLKLHDESATNKIPKNIVQFWDKKEVPPRMKEVMTSWSHLNPEFDYELFDDQSAQEFIQKHHSSEVLKAFRLANHPAMHSDLFRMAYLYEYGGVYADADDLCIRPISEFIDDGSDLIFSQEPTGSIGNNFLAVKPKHVFIQYALNSIVNNILNKAGGVWFASGPGALTISFCQMYIDFLERAQVPAGVAIKANYCLHQFVTPHLSLSYKTTSSGWRSPAGQASRIYR
ncbi:tetratricopeptide repeat protein [Polynucleobacter sp. JS-JIR-II-c23]|uniref:tetratricopeptide repeat protein n=1 Tax=Polynucleobacter sp. JS-JIR-II-c23 TaxID=1758393 RepID=UPI002B2364E9|nr:tetratricopeptide repeat protein [Polynucleobacter sp. JS-JIR-II-c23]MEA9603819.1 tetratricopeptide repeat protein [Polynucleobacter sp. JS-JIR-II-c23]